MSLVEEEGLSKWRRRRLYSVIVNTPRRKEIYSYEGTRRSRLYIHV